MYRNGDLPLKYNSTVCPRSLDPFKIVSYNTKVSYNTTVSYNTKVSYYGKVSNYIK